ncbi:hypothetical protein HDU85_001389 [Gaertneriomyces sp. JEL0708]|nr:hypothetical protein HDU85_001389 [Gaertneriomyces sp. JEL0708]
MVAQSGQEGQQDLDLADITHPISRQPRPRMFSYPKPDNTGDLTDRNTTQHVRRISSEKAITTPPGEVFKKGLTDHKVTKDLPNEASAELSSHTPHDMSTMHMTHKSPDVPLSNPTILQSSPRRSTSYAVRSPAENKYMSPRMRSVLHKFASAEQLLIQDSVTWLDILGGDRIPQPQDRWDCGNGRPKDSKLTSGSHSQEAFDLEMLSLQIGESVGKYFLGYCFDI